MSARVLLFLVLAIALAAPPTPALIVVSGDGQGNTVAPPDDFGFANVGDAGQTVVYVGQGWVITANHVPLGRVSLDGIPYDALPGSKVRIKNEEEGVSPDLAMFRLEEAPPLPALEIRSSPPRVGDLVLLAGNGFARGAALELDEMPGWVWSRESALRWGTNRVKSVGLKIPVSVGSITVAFETDFSGRGATEHEAQVTIGDSGGGAFIEHDGTWELAGVLFAAEQYENQAKRTAIQGNLTYIADLSVYREQILAVMACDRDAACLEEHADRASPCTSICGEGFAWSVVVPLLVRRRSRLLVRRTSPSWARRRRRPLAPS